MKICVLLTYANPHVTGWLDEFIRITNHEVIVGAINSVKNYRKNYFTNADEKNGYLYFFKNNGNEKLFYSHLRQCDCLVTLGIFEFAFIKAYFLMQKSKMVLVLSEPFNPFNKRKLFLRKFYVQIIKLFKKDSTFNFLCMGGQQVKNEYHSMGFRNASYFQFGHFPEIELCMKENCNSSPSIRFIYVGQLIHRKGVEILIAAIKYLKRKYTNWELLIVGKGILKDELMENCKGENRIHYIENIEDPSVIKSHFNNSHILLLPSYFDGWGAVVNEALSSCCSLLLSENVYAGKSLLKSEENGFKFDPYHINELYPQLDKYFQNPGILNLHFKESAKIFLEWNYKNAAFSFNNFLDKQDNPQNETLLKRV